MVKNFKTVNEIRKEHDLEEIPELDKIKSPGELLLDSSWIQAWQSSMQAAAQQEEMMGQQGMEGMPPEGGEENVAYPEEGEGKTEEPDYENMSPELKEAYEKHLHEEASYHAAVMAERKMGC